jgi:hypothetical protein
MMKILVSLLLVCALCASIRPAVADPIARKVRLKTPATCTTTGGTVVKTPAGTVLAPPPLWAALDVEMKRLQVAEIRLGAENKSLRESLKKRPAPWYYIAGALTLGFAAGFAYKAVR